MYIDSIGCVIIIADVLELVSVLGSVTIRDKIWAILWGMATIWFIVFFTSV